MDLELWTQALYAVLVFNVNEYDENWALDLYLGCHVLVLWSYYRNRLAFVRDLSGDLIRKAFLHSAQKLAEGEIKTWISVIDLANIQAAFYRRPNLIWLF